MIQFYLTKEIKKFVLIYGISRIFLLFIPASLPDIPYVSMSLNSALFARDIPYPPLFQLQLALFFFFFGSSLVGYRIGLTIYEIGCLVVLFKFAYQLQRIGFQRTEPAATKSAIKIIYVFAFFPNTIFNYSGSVEHIAAFLMILGLMAYYQDKLVQSSIFFSLSALMEIYPIFCLIPILLLRVVHKQFKPLFQISGVFILIFILGNLPFYLLNPTDFFSNYFIHFSRVPRAESLWAIPYNLGVTWDLLSVGNLLELSPIGLGLIIWLLLYVVFSTGYFLKNRVVSKQEEFAIIAIFMLLLPVVFLSLFPRYIFFGLPILCLLFEITLETEKLLVRARKITIIIIIASIVTLTFWPKIIIFTVQKEILVLDNFLLYFIVFYGMYLFISIEWLKFPQKDRFIPNNGSKIYRNLIFVFMVFFLQILIVTGPIQSLIGASNESDLLLNLIKIISFGIGILPVLRSIKIIFNEYLSKSNIVLRKL